MRSIWNITATIIWSGFWVFDLKSMAVHTPNIGFQNIMSNFLMSLVTEVPYGFLSIYWAQPAQRRKMMILSSTSKTGWNARKWIFDFIKFTREWRKNTEKFIRNKFIPTQNIVGIICWYSMTDIIARRTTVFLTKTSGFWFTDYSWLFFLMKNIFAKL